MLESPATGITDPATTTESDDGEPTTTSPPPEDSQNTAPDHAPAQRGDETDDEDEAGSETDTSPSPELQQLKATLEANDLTVTVEDAETLAVVRLGQPYYIQADGSVEGDGALRAQLETIIANAT